jgi:hypothetical protein
MTAMEAVVDDRDLITAVQNNRNPTDAPLI